VPRVPHAVDHTSHLFRKAGLFGRLTELREETVREDVGFAADGAAFLKQGDYLLMPLHFCPVKRAEPSVRTVRIGAGIEQKTHEFRAACLRRAVQRRSYFARRVDVRPELKKKSCEGHGDVGGSFLSWPLFLSKLDRSHQRREAHSTSGFDVRPMLQQQANN